MCHRSRKQTPDAMWAGMCPAQPAFGGSRMPLPRVRVRWHTEYVDVADLPDGSPLWLEDVDLPTGRLVQQDDRMGGVAAPSPILWLTNDVLGAPGLVWERLVSAAEANGLSAVLLENLRGTEYPSGRPWDSREFVAPLGYRPDDYDQEVVFRERWNMSVPIGSLAVQDRPPPLFPVGGTVEPEYEEDEEETTYFLEQVAPWGIPFPGLALMERSPGDAERFKDAVEGTPPARIGLVGAGRPADIPHTLGWMGATNHFLRADPPGATILSVMMRTWEDRFGARLFRLGFDTMVFLVDRPPSTEASALAVAAEHFAFAGSDGFQAYSFMPVESFMPVDSIRSLAGVLINNPEWRFWWD